MTLLEVEQLSARYGRSEVLHGISFTVEDGAAVVILGANGAGKSTTLRAITGGTKNRGRISFNGADITRAPRAAIVRMGISLVPEGRGTFTEMTVEENLRLGSYLRRDRLIADDLDRHYVTWPRLKERRKQQAGSLSGGEQQMLAIARALMSRPRLLVLDEPSLGLAPLIVQELYATLAKLRAEVGMAMLIVEQNANLALDMADYAYVLESGSVVHSAPAQDIAGDEQLRSAYLGI